MDMSFRRGRWGQWPRRLTAGLSAAGLATQLACHTYQPLQESVPVTGREIAIEINDRGRVMVGGQLGEAVHAVEGKVIEATDSQVTLSVARTVSMRGSTAVWAGEQVSVPREAVRGFRVRQYSRSRTVMLALGSFAGLVLLGVGLTIVGGGSGRPIGSGGCEVGCEPR